MIVRTVTIAVLLTLGVLPAPADAQRRQRIVEVFGNDRCPEGTDGEIVVCARKPESDRFRIPEQFREPSATDRESQETRVDEAVALGRTGTDSCSPVGPGGHTGCFVQQVRQNRDEKRAIRRARSAEPR
ncbi:MAG TPA: hypothetical protein VEZ48_03655 [Sphingomonadaceae bacterium]|nr:hypothetical protein [Sphingomonadaceae bacterium]